jgi:hypothetical protein
MSGPSVAELLKLHRKEIDRQDRQKISHIESEIEQNFAKTRCIKVHWKHMPLRSDPYIQNLIERGFDVDQFDCCVRICYH